MRPTWLIEAGVYGDEATPLLAEIRRQGMVGETVPHQSLKKGSTPVIRGQAVAADGCVIGYGTFPFVRQIQLHQNWIPGTWCSVVNLDCATYYAYFGKFLLNENYVIMPGVEAIRQSNWLFSIFGRDDEVFARPTSCHKLFTGRLVDRTAFANALAPTRYDPTSQVVIARPRHISREWRVIVSGDRVIAGSQYAVNGERDITPEFPKEVEQFASSILSQVQWRPDPIFMLDIGQSDDNLRLMELNSFSGSWIYRCSLSAVVHTASELAERAYESRNV